MKAGEIIDRFIAEADQRPPHIPLDVLIVIIERQKFEQGGRLTAYQMRFAAASLLAAAKLPADLADITLRPEWLTPQDKKRFLLLCSTPGPPDDVGSDGFGDPLTRH